MRKFKLTSIRVCTDSIDSAHALANQLYYYNTSDMLRLAMWVGLKVITPRCVSDLNRMMWKEEAGLDIITTADVLRTAGVIDDEHKG